MAISVVRAFPRDLSKLGELRFELFRLEGFSASLPLRIEQIWRDWVQHGTVLLAKDARGALKGSATIVHYGSSLARIRPGEVELRFLCVKRSARRRGIATRLLCAVLDEARKSYASRIIVHVPNSAGDAIAFLEDSAFNRAPTRDHVIRGRRFASFTRELEAGNDSSAHSKFYHDQRTLQLGALRP